MTTMRLRLLRRTLFIAAGIAAAIVAATSWVLGSQLIQPVNCPVPLPPDFPARVVSIAAPGHEVAGWWLDQGGNSPVVLLLHGIRANRSSMLTRAKLLVRQGFSVLLVDLQAHGETPGAAITLGRRESADVQAAWHWLERAAPGRPLGAIGFSLGGAALLLGPQPAGFDAVVLEAVYPRVDSAVENRIRLRLGPLAPVLAPLLLVQLGPRLHVAPRDLEPIRSIGRLGCPVLVVAGSRDEHTTLAESQELFDAAAAPKRFWVVEGARHEDFLGYDSAGYEKHVVGFLREHLATRPETVFHRPHSTARLIPH